MIRICDRCGQPMEEGALRYEAHIKVFAAYDPLEISFEDLEKDHSAELEQIAAQCRDKTEDELMRDVYVELRFDLCPACQHSYLMNPLSAGK